MKHSFLDQYADGDSLVHRLDPRTKLAITFLFILLVVLTPADRWLAFASYAVVITILILLSRVPVLYVLKRSLAVIPFVLLIAIFIPFFKEGQVAGSYNVWLWRITVTHNGLNLLANIMAKAWLSMLILIWLTATTRWTSLLQALEQFRMPQVLVMILSFMYRYLFILVDEAIRLKQARDSRNAGGGRRLRQIRTIGNMTGILFIRSYERGERVYAAMVARGFDGQSRTLKRLSFRRLDVYFSASLGSVLVLISLVTLLH